MCISLQIKVFWAGELLITELLSTWDRIWDLSRRALCQPYRKAGMSPALVSTSSHTILRERCREELGNVCLQNLKFFNWADNLVVSEQRASPEKGTLSSAACPKPLCGPSWKDCHPCAGFSQAKPWTTGWELTHLGVFVTRKNLSNLPNFPQFPKITLGCLPEKLKWASNHCFYRTNGGGCMHARWGIQKIAFCLCTHPLIKCGCIMGTTNPLIILLLKVSKT